MRKRLLLIILPVMLLAMLLSFFAVSPASAATRQQAAPAVTKAAALGPRFCLFQVIAIGGLNARSNRIVDFSTYQYTIPQGNQVYATLGTFPTANSSNNNFRWRELDDGNWVVDNPGWIQRVPGNNCFTPPS